MPNHISSFNNPRGGDIVTTRYIQSLDQLEQNVGETKYLLRVGTYYFDSGTGGPFVLDKPFELDDSVGGTIDIIANLLYLGTGPLFQQAIGNQLILRLTDTVLIGEASPPGTRTLFDLSFSTAGSQPILLINFVQCLFWNDLGDIRDFSTIVINNYADQFNNFGLAIFDATNLVNIDTATLTNALVAASRISIVQGASLVTGTSIQVSAVQFTPDAVLTQYAFNIDAALQPNAIINGSVFNDNGNANAGFYNPAGIDQTSIFVLSKDVKNVEDTKVSGGYFYNGTQVTFLTQTIGSVDLWHMLPGTTLTSPAIVLDTNDRISVPTTNAGNRVLLANSTLENTRVEISLYTTVQPVSGSPTLQLAIFRLGETETWDTTNGDPLLFTTGGGNHPYVSGDFAYVGDSTNLVGFLESGLYFISDTGADNITLRPFSGAPNQAPNATTSGQFITSKATIVGFSPVFGTTSTVEGLPIATSTTVSSMTNFTPGEGPDRFVAAVRNRTATQSLRFFATQFRMDE